MEEPSRIFDLLPRFAALYDPKDDVLAAKQDGKWVKYSIDQYRDFAEAVSYGLLALGIRQGDTVASISNNRPEWNFLDMGLSQIGAVHVPIYPTISESDYRYILSHAGVKLVFVSGKDLLRKIDHILPDVPSLQGIYSFNKIDEHPGFEELIELGKKNQDPVALGNIKDSIHPNDLTTIIYTSGTTGNPKGVMLSHNNILSNVMAVKHIPDFGQEARVLSYLPLCHVYERMLNYLYQYLGFSIYYAENMGTIAENAKEISPYMLTTVPRLLEKIYDKIIAKGRKLPWIQKQIFFWSVNLGLRYEYDKKNGVWYEFQLKIANQLVFRKWREALGGKIRLMVSGGAALQPRLARVFTAAGIHVLEGYGLTETSPVIAVNQFGEGGRAFGSVGPPLSNVEVKIADDGEILCKGPTVMLGYYKEPELTKEAIDQDGWFHTGDLGHIEPAGQLCITGRKKEAFKTSMGKFINPELIENKIKESSFIDSVFVVGENKQFAAALIVPEFSYLRSYCSIKEIPYTNDEDMVKLPFIRKRLQREVDKFNAALGATEQVKRIELLGKEWSIETGELAGNLKMRRKYITQKYQKHIDMMYE